MYWVNLHKHNGERQTIPLVEDGLPTDSVYQALHKRLANNLTEIMDAANERGVKVYIIATVPHLNYPPFYDANSPNLIEQNIQQYTQGIGQAKQLERERKWSEMEQVLTDALKVESHHATGHYLLGTALQNQQKYSDALQARKRALLLDISRKRTLPSYAQIVSEVCEHAGCQTQQSKPLV